MNNKSKNKSEAERNIKEGNPIEKERNEEN